MGGYVDDVNVSLQSGPSRADSSLAGYGVETGSGPWVVNMKGVQSQGSAGWLTWALLGLAAFALWRSKGGG